MNKVMVVILLFNRQPLSKLCIENLFNYTLEPFDLFLWDNASEKPMQELLDKMEGLKFVNGSTVTIIRNKVNFGAGGSQAETQKLRKPGQHYLKLDNDLLVPKDPNWLTTLREILEKNTDGFQVIGYPIYDSKYFFENDKMFIPTGLKLSSPLTTDGRIRVLVYRTLYVIGLALLSSIFMDKFRFPSGVKKYGEGDDMSIWGFAHQNKIPMIYTHPPSMPEYMEGNDYLLAMCPEFREYHDWKVTLLKAKDKNTPDFHPTKVGNDTSELKIRKELIL
jgi:hypothetical protein